MQSFSKSIVASVSVLVIFIAVAIDASACQICIGFPKKTDADLLLDSYCVLLARPKEQDPFQYSPREVLKGAYDGSNIDLLVDSASRRLLQIHEDRSVLLVQARQGGPWQTMGLISRDFEAVARRLVTLGPEWIGTEATKNRWQFFLPLFGNSDQRIRDLAYLEIGRAPYSVVRQLGKCVSRESISPFLENRQYVEWQGLAILLLAQNESPSDRKRILDSFEDAMHFGLVMNLSARAAAAMEIDSVRILELIEAEYFANSNRSPEELDAVFRAISMHGSQDDVPQRNRIVASYGRLLRRTPQFAPQIAADLHAWNRTEHTDIFAEILTQPNGFDFNAVRAIRRYLRMNVVAVAARHIDD